MHRLLFNKTNFLVKPPAINSALQNLNGKLGINQNSAGNQINKSHQRKTHVLTKTSALWLFTLWGKTQNFVILYLINNVRCSILEINSNPSYPLRALWCYIYWTVHGLLQKQQNLNQTQHCLGGSREDVQLRAGVLGQFWVQPEPEGWSLQKVCHVLYTV